MHSTCPKSAACMMGEKPSALLRSSRSIGSALAPSSTLAVIGWPILQASIRAVLPSASGWSICVGARASTSCWITPRSPTADGKGCGREDTGVRESASV
eukprot:scaffold12435_cov69-Phaeocystis_antarctica.AAC.7